MVSSGTRVIYNAALKIWLSPQLVRNLSFDYVVTNMKYHITVPKSLLNQQNTHIFFDLLNNNGSKKINLFSFPKKSL